MTETAKQTEAPTGSVPGRLMCLEIRNGLKLFKVYGNVLDLEGKVRVQRGFPELHGFVLEPGEYKFCWWADEEED